MLSSLAVLAASAVTMVAADSVTTGNASSYYATSAPIQTYQSVDFTAPEFNVLTYDETKASPNLTMLSYRGTATSPSPLVMDNNGSLVWSGNEAGYTNTMDLRVQSYKGEDVLTFFTGVFSGGGYANGSWNILSNNYTEIRTIYNLNQTAETSDFHEMILTERNSALVEAWTLAETDLTGTGYNGTDGSTTGWTWDCNFEEIDISGETDELMFKWSSIEAGVLPSESYFTSSDNSGNSSDNAFDSCHINTVNLYAANETKSDDDLYLISLRGPSTLYLIDGTGAIVWRLGGKYSNFTMGGTTNLTSTGATFWYQHDARLAPGSDIRASKFNITIFDNAAGGGDPVEAMARIMTVECDTDAWTATLVFEAFPSFGTVAASQGSHRVDETTGNHMAGWGATPAFTEYDSEGNIVHDVIFGAVDSVVQSYRVFKQSWTGYPLTSPSLAVNSTSAYVSWNGATEVASWTLMGGTSESAATTVLSANVTKSGFETAIPLTGSDTYLAVAAMGSDGTCLGVSAVYSTSTMAATSTNGTCPSGSTVAAAGTNGTSTASGSSSTSSSTSAAGRAQVGVVGALVAIAGAMAVML